MSESYPEVTELYEHDPKGLSLKDFLHIPTDDISLPEEAAERMRRMAFMLLVRRARLTGGDDSRPDNGGPVLVDRKFLDTVVTERHDMAVPVYGMGEPGFELISQILANSRPAEVSDTVN